MCHVSAGSCVFPVNPLAIRLARGPLLFLACIMIELTPQCYLGLSMDSAGRDKQYIRSHKFMIYAYSCVVMVIYHGDIFIVIYP